MRIRWLGHSAFLLTAADGTRIITDPYKPGGELAYGRITEPADFVTVSHNHFDHNDVASVPGSPKVIRSSGSHKAAGVSISGFDSFHDEERGTRRGKNIIFLFQDAGLRVAHLGDLGHVPTEQAKTMGRADVVLIPIGGNFTIDPAAAHRTAEVLGARIVVPMHFRTAKCTLPIVGVEEFTRGHSGVKRLGTEVEVNAGSLPSSEEIWVLEHAL
jgi:L-ascorbate metabolism protein UlaG (beta-lactamase superfamily)